MARLLALEWDQREARVVAASKRGNAIEVQDAFSIPLSGRTVAPLTLEEISAQISSALTERGLTKCDALVAINRASIELKLLSLPPAPPAELPQLIRFQAMREFHTLAEDWPLDYLPLTTTEQQQTVLAASIAPELVQQVVSTCSAAGLKAQRIALRPAAAATLLRRQPAASEGTVRLLIDVLTDEADLSVLVGNDLVFTRTARLPAAENPADRLAALQAEVRRTMVAAQNQQPGGKVSALYLCGSQAEDTGVATALGERLQLPATILNPLELVPLTGTIRKSQPSGVGRFAPLIGMLLDEADQLRPAFDFLAPRKYEPRRPQQRTVGLAVGLAVSVVLAIVAWIWHGLSSLDEETAELTTRLQQLDKEVKTAATMQKETGEIDQWAASDVFWLGELDYLSRKYPAAADARVLNMRMLPEKAGGRIDLDGAARTAEILDSAEQSLRDASHNVLGQGTHQEPEAERYKWQFGAAVLVLPKTTGAKR